jgi:TM2 domain-containing membrane protein YozV
MKNRGMAIVIAFLFGWVGFHKFYLGKSGQGFMYLLFFWTWIPAILTIIDVLRLVAMGEQKFNETYNHALTGHFCPMCGAQKKTA